MALLKKVKVLRSNVRALRSYRRKRATLAHLPTYLWVEPTNTCNLHCPMCPNGAGRIRAERGFMDLGLYRRLIDDVRSYVGTVTLSMGGESLLHPGLGEMAAYAGRSGLKTILNTNATLLDERTAAALLDSGLDYVSFAFDGFTKASYERARRGADFEATLSNILRFLRMKEERRARKPFTVLSMLDLGWDRPTAGEREAFLARFGGRLDDVRVREVNSWGRMFKGTTEFPYRAFDRSYPCGRLWNTLAVAWNGDVVPCVFHLNHEYVVGNIAAEPLAAVWNSPRLVALRQAMLDGRALEISPLCDNCTIAGSPAMFGIPAGLRATLAAALTDFFGPGFEKRAVALAERRAGGRFAARRIKFRGKRGLHAP